VLTVYKNKAYPHKAYSLSQIKIKARVVYSSLSLPTSQHQSNYSIPASMSLTASTSSVNEAIWQ